jgi:predicted extracellular nuclease
MLSERNPIFSRDCAEFEVSSPSGARLLVMLNHFKSKGFGSQQSSSAKRRAQAKRVAEIYDERVAMGIKNIAVMGDFNDTPDRSP